MLPHVMELLAQERISARVRFGESVRAAQDRKQTALIMRAQVINLGNKIIATCRSSYIRSFDNLQLENPNTDGAATTARKDSSR